MFYLVEPFKLFELSSNQKFCFFRDRESVLLGLEQIWTGMVPNSSMNLCERNYAGCFWKLLIGVLQGAVTQNLSSHSSLQVWWAKVEDIGPLRMPRF